jgi:hypothetical protein
VQVELDQSLIVMVDNVYLQGIRWLSDPSCMYILEIWKSERDFRLIHVYVARHVGSFKECAIAGWINLA